MILGVTFPVLLVLALAHYRVTRLWLTDSITKPLRDRAFKRFPPEEGVYLYIGADGRVVLDEAGHMVKQREESFIGELLSCPWCIGFHIGVVQTAIFLLNPVLCVALCFPFALGAVTGIIHGKV